MKNRLLLTALVLVFALGSVYASADGAAQTMSTFEGKVKSVDAKTMTVVVQNGEDSKSFIVGHDVTMMRQGAPRDKVAFADLKAGERILVHYTMTGTTMTASKMELLPAQTAAVTQPATKPSATKTE